MQCWMLGRWLICVALVYFSAQCFLYAQDRTQVAESGPATPYEHLTLEAALLIVVSVQYKENRTKEAAATKMASDAAAAIARATAIMEQVTQALERLSEKVEECPVRLDYDRRPKH